jgi:hypothetical protein
MPGDVEKIRMDRLIHSLRKVSPQTLLRKAQGDATIAGENLGSLICRMVAGAYNKGLPRQDKIMPTSEL